MGGRRSRPGWFVQISMDGGTRLKWSMGYVAPTLTHNLIDPRDKLVVIFV
jgi:hypothetical protein